ncbi:hypothetical protein [Caballeronia zhejiangensis]|uniref:Uncharacterized protein n=1 Tax=Caballeronia zhejiangensis TaxID=871203 RepID=A0A656Q9P6_9BURK|nr:hypothetical protein [Caballeronia zhejiangensis]KDR26003.1 hypothetical protein BG60_26520 [Caballeronia zhejiangensis]
MGQLDDQQRFRQAQSQQDAEMQARQNAAYAQIRAGMQQAAAPKGGLNSMLSMRGSTDTTPAKNGIAGTSDFGSTTPAIGAGTGEGASGLYGMGGMAQMAGGGTGNGQFTLGGSSAAVGGSAAAGTASLGSAAPAGETGGGFNAAPNGPWTSLFSSAQDSFK